MDSSNEQNNRERSAYSILSGTMSHVSMLIAATSIFSLMQRSFEFGMAQIVSDFVTYYRRVADALFGSIPALFGIELPEYLPDMWALSFIGAGFLINSAFEGPTRENLAQLTFKWQVIAHIPKLLGVLVFGFTPLGLYGLYTLIPAGLISLIWMHRRVRAGEDYDEEEYAYKMRLASRAASLAIALIALFILNAYAPSIG